MPILSRMLQIPQTFNFTEDKKSIKTIKTIRERRISVEILIADIILNFRSKKNTTTK